MGCPVLVKPIYPDDRALCSMNQVDFHLLEYKKNDPSGVILTVHQKLRRVSLPLMRVNI
jgi:hypothetical protein